MTTYIALLKGINVGGNNIIKMADLKQYLTAMGLSNVRTYIQSGNVLFESAKEEKILQSEIEQEIYKRFGFQVLVVLRTSEEMKQLIDQSPFPKEKIEAIQASKEVEVFYVAFFNEPLSQKEVDYLSDSKADNESFQIIGRDLYMLFNDSIRFSKLAVALPKIKAMNTVRNWKTINKLILLANP